jgi:ribonuclease P/MRP protein subunit RPP40
VTPNDRLNRAPASLKLNISLNKASYCISGCFYGAILMDLSKAFDCLPHRLLISKLHAYNVSNSACQLIAYYLCNRRQNVKIGNCKSSWRQTAKGVPQGSGLGPLIFNIFINDIFLFTKQCFMLNYADDNTNYACDANHEVVLSKLHIDANIAIQWFTDNYMQANPSKFQVIFLKPKKKLDPFPMSIDVSGKSIKRETSVKLLGIQIDSRLNFNDHVTILCRKAARQLNCLKRVSKNLTSEVRLKIYYSFIFSNFNFCPLVWHFCSKKSTQKLEKINERALRIVFNDHGSTYTELLSLHVSLDSLHTKRLKTIATEAYRCIYKQNPEPMHMFCIPKETFYAFRNSLCVEVPLVNTTSYGLMSFKYFSSHLWNQLPDNIKHAINVKDFKAKIKLWTGPACQCNLCQRVLI